MTKVAIINDTHFGMRNFNKSITKNQLEFFEFQFFPYLLENKINHIIHLGDIFDNRESLNIKMIHIFKKHFFDFLKDNHITMDIIIGNHDITYRQSNKINSPQSILNEYDNIKVYSECEDVNVFGLDICFVPWINNENQESTIEKVNATKSKLLFGHLELNGFKMEKGGTISTDHYVPIQACLDKFDMVLSGHYHHKSTYKNITYLGTQYEMTWSDANDTKGFYILDTNNPLQLEYVINENTLFNTLEYNDKTKLKDIDTSKVADKFVKLVVQSKKSESALEQYIQRMLSLNPSDLKIEDTTLFVGTKADDTEVNINDTRSMLSTYINLIEYSRKEELGNLLLRTYDKCYEEQWNGKEV